jgi:hypothetical protein
VRILKGVVVVQKNEPCEWQQVEQKGNVDKRESNRKVILPGTMNMNGDLVLL